MKRNIEKHIRFSEEEYEKVTEKAKELGVSPGKYIRRAAVECEINIYDLKELNSIKYAFNRIGNSVNQIAKVANSNQSVYGRDIEEMQKQIKELRTCLEKYLPKLYARKVK